MRGNGFSMGNRVAELSVSVNHYLPVANQSSVQ